MADEQVSPQDEGNQSDDLETSAQTIDKPTFLISLLTDEDADIYSYLKVLCKLSTTQKIFL
jgi:hypothetical protein